MPNRKKRASGFCVSCGCTTATRFRNTVGGHIRRYSNPGAGRHRKIRDQVCGACYNRKETTTAPFVAKSRIKNAGNGLFANKDFGYGEIVCEYGGKILDERPRGESRYIICMQIGGETKYSDARYGGGPGRYINEHDSGQNNVRFCAVGGAICIKTVSKDYAVTNLGHRRKSKIAVKKGDEFYVSYGSEYWK
jgi:hypothetical protein